MFGWIYFVLLELATFFFVQVPGVVILAPMAASHAWVTRESTVYPGKRVTVWKGGKLTWLWGNEENGVTGPIEYNADNTAWKTYVWSAWRNSANNVRFLVSWKGGPWFQYRGKNWYIQFGFRPDTGWPVFSPGKGTGTVL